MSFQSRIEWTESTWNPVTGCTKVSAGCQNCYAERMAKRLKAMGNPNYQNGFECTVHPHMLNKPITWKKPQMIFVNSMSDLFHEKVPDGFIQSVFQTMNHASHHVFQVLTKRDARLLNLAPKLNWSSNIWLGVSVESDQYVSRIDNLRPIPAAIKFLSIEPLISPTGALDLTGIDWVIVGGESGPGARPIEADWVRFIRDQCLKSNTPFFFKQWGGTNKKKAGRLLDGRTWDQMPHAYLVQKKVA